MTTHFKAPLRNFFFSFLRSQLRSNPELQTIRTQCLRSVELRRLLTGSEPEKASFWSLGSPRRPSAPGLWVSRSSSGAERMDLSCRLSSCIHNKPSSASNFIPRLVVTSTREWILCHRVLLFSTLHKVVAHTNGLTSSTGLAPIPGAIAWKSTRGYARLHLTPAMT